MTLTERLSAGPAILLLSKGQFRAGADGEGGGLGAGGVMTFTPEVTPVRDSEHVGTAVGAEVQSAAASGRILNPCGWLNANHSRRSNYISSCCPGGC